MFVSNCLYRLDTFAISLATCLDTHVTRLPSLLEDTQSYLSLGKVSLLVVCTIAFRTAGVVLSALLLLHTLMLWTEALWMVM